MEMRVIIEIDPFDGCEGCKGKVEGRIRKMKRRLGSVGEIELLAWGDEKEKLTVLTTINPDAIVAALMCKFRTKKITWSQDVTLPVPDPHPQNQNNNLTGQPGPPTTPLRPHGQFPSLPSPIRPTAPPLPDFTYETHYYPWPMPLQPIWPTAPPFPTDPTYGLSDPLLWPPPQPMPTAPSFYDWARNPFR
ncbi:leucine-rich repeat extensin-like protein 5 [Cynara cardunculus var. scolymus]|uniref:leucine-rich repeat extensin-like protein 5 n=1 Tax=Cynara cardunculus var. scolymus TaxID=59895 RepID=UPI000D62E8A0|nr:leucine-rich repeat extensin-like protein 5 [Cynara cardunculus var. scolymus]